MSRARQPAAVRSEHEDLIADMFVFFDAVERGDRETVHDLAERRCHPECELTSAVSSQFEGTRRGHEEIKRFFSELLDVWNIRYADQRFESVGSDAIVLRYRQTLEGKASRVELNAAGGVIWWLDGDRATRVVTYIDADELERAVSSIEEGNA